MDWLGRIFYTVLSLSGIILFLTPFVLLLRLGMRNHEKQFMKWEWRLIYLRSICPVALSSAICLFDGWNRRYHLFLAGLGLTIKGQRGVMNSWSAVFFKEIEMTKTFAMCAIFWAAGVVVVLLGALVSQRKVCRALLSVKELGEDLYESKLLAVPVRLGVFHHKHYFPEEMHTKEMSWYLKHSQQHSCEAFQRSIVMLITSIHWFNPAMWLFYILWEHDTEYLADEKTVYKKAVTECQDYAQGILNFKKKKKSFTLSPLTAREGNVEKRATRMMYMKWDTTGARLMRFLLYSVTLIVFFLLTPMKIAWTGGTWQKPADNSKGTLFEEKEGTVIAKADTLSPEGLDRVLQLEMLTKAKEEQAQYTGEFVLRMYDDFNNLIATMTMEDIFGSKANMQFPKTMTLYIGDYNGDGTQEAVLGKKLTLSQKEFEREAPKTLATEKVKDYEIYSYRLINLENDALQVVNNNICAAVKKGGKKTLEPSIAFETLENADTIFGVPFGKKRRYYVWNEKTEVYEKKELTKKELNQYKKGEEIQSREETKEHTLENDAGEVEVLVSTQKDADGNEDIQSLVLSPRANDRKFENIHGFYCDLQWVSVEDLAENRYAMLIYNGTKAQTFTIYDTKSRTVFYQHENGTTQLEKVFQQYNEDDITFSEGGAVIYHLKTLKEDKVTIGFAANADNHITVKGSYEYDIKKKTASNFAYSREVNGENGTGVTPESN